MTIMTIRRSLALSAALLIAPAAFAQNPAPQTTPAPQAVYQPAPGTLIADSCDSCGGIGHGHGHGCGSIHAAQRSWLYGRRIVRLQGTCKFPLNRLSGPAGYWDSPGPMAGESIVPGAAFDRAPIPVGVMVP